MNPDHGICRLGWGFRKRHRVRGRNKGNVDHTDNSDDGQTNRCVRRGGGLRPTIVPADASSSSKDVTCCCTARPPRKGNMNKRAISPWRGECVGRMGSHKECSRVTGGFGCCVGGWLSQDLCCFHRPKLGDVRI